MIIDLGNVKEIIQINVDTYDALIETFIPIAISDFLDIRGIPFFTVNGEITSGSNIIEVNNTDDMKNLQYKDVIESAADEGATFNGRITYIDKEDVEITIDTEATSSDDDLDMVVYPGNAKYVLSKIIDYQMNKDNSNGYKTETFGNYTYTKFDPRYGLPADLSKMVKAYHRVR